MLLFKKLLIIILVKLFIKILPSILIPLFLHIFNFLKKDKEQLTLKGIDMINSKVIEPCYISSNVALENSTIGPHVSINSGCKVSNTTVSNSIIGENTILLNADIRNSMIGNNCKYDGRHNEINIGDFSELI